MRFLDEDDDDPMLSVVNLIDLFLVIIGMLMVENPGEDNMRITVKDGQELTRYESSGEMGEGQGARAGVTYRLDDGRMIYVPE